MSMSNSKTRRGFSLIELLIVISIILIIVTVALPKLNNATRFAHETAAIKAIQTIHTMQVQYNSQYGRFATSLAELGPPASGGPTAAAADLIGNDLAGGEKSGYKFTVSGVQGGYTINANPVELRHQRNPHLLFGSEHGGPRELRPGTGHRQQQRVEIAWGQGFCPAAGLPPGAPPESAPLPQRAK